MVEKCDKCGKEEGPMQLCSACKTVRYCSVICQRAAWKSHKTSCQKKKTVQAEPAASKLGDKVTLSDAD